MGQRPRHCGSDRGREEGLLGYWGHQKDARSDIYYWQNVRYHIEMVMWWEKRMKNGQKEIMMAEVNGHCSRVDIYYWQNVRYHIEMVRSCDEKRGWKMDERKLWWQRSTDTAVGVNRRGNDTTRHEVSLSVWRKKILMTEACGREGSVWPTLTLGGIKSRLKEREAAAWIIGVVEIVLN